MKQILVISLALLVASCGYTPLYKEGPNSATADIEELSQISIDPLENRLGQVMYNRLLDLFGTSGTSQYRLSIQLDEKIEGYGFRQDAAVTQEEVTIVANVQLRRVADDMIVYTDTLTERTSFDVALSDHANVTQRDDAKERLVRQLSLQLHRRLAVHFRQN